MQNLLLSLAMQEQALFIQDREELKRKVEAYREFGATIVLTQGVYDMFHNGHTRYFRQAKSFGHVLIVAVDTDELTKKLKGDDRPFDPEEERFEVVRSQRTVDLVVPKGVDEHKHDIIKLISPDVLVVSLSTGPSIQNDIDELSQMCGELKNLPRQSSTTTTAKLRKLRIETAKEMKKAIDDTIGKE